MTEDTFVRDLKWLQSKLSFLVRARTRPMIRTALPGFDPVFYLYWYRDAGRYPHGLARHYLDYGWREGRDPSAGFSTLGYLMANPDVRASGLNPLIHFLEIGLTEGRSGWQKNPGFPPPRPQPPGYYSGKLLPPPTGSTVM